MSNHLIFIFTIVKYKIKIIYNHDGNLIGVDKFEQIVKDHLLEATVIHNPYIGNLLQKRSWQNDKVYRYDV